MKTVMRAATMLLAMVMPAVAAGGGETNGISLLVILFLAMGALVVVFQFIPALMLLYGALKGLFARNPDQASIGIPERTGRG